jgi:hypothetical protein
MSAEEPTLSYRCDRCGTTDPHSWIVGWPTPNAVYWLCWECINAIIMMWLVEHQERIQRVRRAVADKELAG